MSWALYEEKTLPRPKLGDDVDQVCKVVEQGWVSTPPNAWKKSSKETASKFKLESIPRPKVGFSVN